MLKLDLQKIVVSVAILSRCIDTHLFVHLFSNVSTDDQNTTSYIIPTVVHPFYSITLFSNLQFDMFVNSARCMDSRTDCPLYPSECEDNEFVREACPLTCGTCEGQCHQIIFIRERCSARLYS